MHKHLTSIPLISMLFAACLLAPAAKAQVAFQEDFEGVTITNQVGQFPNGWTTYADDHTNVGNFTMFGNSWCVSQVEADNNAAASVSYVNESGDCDRWLVTPQINVPNASYSLQFRAFSVNASDPEKLRIMVSTSNAQKSSFTTTLRDIVFDGTDGATAGWNNITLPLADYAGQAIYIAFINHGHSQFVFVDDVKVSASTDNYHMALLESFTSQYCGNCPEGDEALEEAYVGLENRVAWISHHAGYQDDMFTIDASKTLEALYNTGTYAPAFAIDRNMDLAASNPGPVHQVEDAVIMHLALSRASSMIDNIALSITDIDYTAASRNLRLSVDGYFIADQTINNPRLTVYLVEDSLIAFQYSSDIMNNYRHDHVARACLTADWGDEGVITSTTAGSTFHKDFSYTLPATLRADKCYLVALVSEQGSSTATERRVYNTTKSGYITSDAGQPLGIDEATPTLTIKAYPNPATQKAYISCPSTIRSFSVADMSGRTVKASRNLNANHIELDVADLPTGIYIVSAVTAQGIATERLHVVR